MKSKATIINSVILTLFLTVFLGVPTLTNAKLLEPIIPGTIEGTGTHFEITDSEYLNIVLDSSEEIELTMESMPEMVTMMIKPVSSDSTAQITLSGFAPLTTYYKYQDDYHNLCIFTTDENGSYAYAQDLSKPHFIFIQPRASTKFIKDDVNGGDCSSIGIWNNATKTCTLTTDVNETIQIDDDGITLDGNGHTVTGSGYGIYLANRTSVTIKNLTVMNFMDGIRLWYSSNNTLIDNNTISNFYGSRFVFSSNNFLTNSSTSNNFYGAFFVSSNNNTFTGNIVSNNVFGLYFTSSNNNEIYNNNFITNSSQVAAYSSNNIFNLSLPTGGNYWSDFDESAEGCNDTDFDDFCDAPYAFTYGQDDYPWTKRDGWATKTLSEQAADLAKLVVNGPYLGDGDTFGGKGWDSVQALYVSSNEIFNGYNYWNNNINKRKIEFGAGLDCSGLTQWAFNRSFDPFKSLLHNVIRYDGADGQYKHNSETVDEADLQRGDLMFFDGRPPAGHIDHVVMYVGDNGTFDVVEAHSPARGIIVSKKDELKTLPEFLDLAGFRRVVLGPSIGGQVKAGSPIDISVTDPDGFTITPTTAIQTDAEYLREVPGELYYTESELGPDGRPEDRVYWPVQKTGNYIIKVTPEEGIVPTETYGLEFQTDDQKIILAENVPLNQIPNEGYGVSVSETGTITTFIPVKIDIKPGSYPNSINLGSKGTAPVVIFGSGTFDVYQIDLNSIRLAGASIKPKKNGQSMANHENINGDSFTDVVVHIITEALQLTPASAEAELNGFLLNGREIKGSDAVHIVP